MQFSRCTKMHSIWTTTCCRLFLKKIKMKHPLKNDLDHPDPSISRQTLKLTDPKDAYTAPENTYRQTLRPFSVKNPK